MSTGARGNPTTQRGVFERLRKEAKGKPTGFQLPLQFRAAAARLDEGRLGNRINFQHPVHELHIDGDNCRVVARRFNPADHAGTSPKGNHGCTDIITPVEQREDILCVTRIRDHIWRMGKIAGECAYRVEEGRAIAMRQTFVVLSGTNPKQSSRNGEAGRTQANVFSRRWRCKVKLADTELFRPHTFQPPDIVGREDISFIPPAPEFELWLNHTCPSCSCFS